MRQQGRTDPRTPYAEEYRNRKGFSETIQDHATRLRDLELRANRFRFIGPNVTTIDNVSETIVEITNPPFPDLHGGVVAYDAVVDENYAGVDGDPTTLATDSVVYRYSAIQPAIDDLCNFVITPALPFVLAVNKGNYNESVLLCGGFGSMSLIGEPGPALVDVAVVIEGLTVQDSTATHRIEGVYLNTDGLIALSEMVIEARRCIFAQITGMITNSLLEDVLVNTAWFIDVGMSTSANVLTRFVRVRLVGGLFTADDLDHEMAGIYSFDACYLSGILGNLSGLRVGTDKHFVIKNDTEVHADLWFDMDGGTLTLDLDHARFTNAARIVITDAGGGGTVIINWSGGSVEQTASPVIEADATIAVTGSVDGVALLGTPNSPAFKGQFVDFTFGDAISPPSYVVEFL